MEERELAIWKGIHDTLCEPIEIRDYGNRNVKLAADMTISKALVVSSTGAD